MKRKFGSAGLVLLLAAAMLLQPAVVHAQPTPAVDLTVSKDAAAMRDRITVTVAGRHLEGLYANEVRLDYDAELLECTEAKLELAEGGLYRRDGAGSVILGHSLTGKESGLSGNKPLYTVVFKAKAKGTAAVRIASVTLIGVAGDRLETLPAAAGAEVKVRIGSTASDDSGPSADAPASPPAGVPKPSPAAAPTPVPPFRPGTAVLLIEAHTVNGSAEAVVDPQQLRERINGTASRSVTLDIRQKEAIRRIQVKLPAELVRLADSKSVTGIVVRTSLASVTIHPSLLRDSSVGAGSSLVLSIAAADREALALEARESLGDAEVYDFDLSLDGRSIHTFPGNEIMVELPYTLKPGENPHEVVVYSITGEGRLEVVKNGKYQAAAGHAAFMPKHFSRYAAASRQTVFQDAAQAPWAEDAIRGLAARGIVQGAGNGRFLPDGRVTRAEFAAMLVNAFDLAVPSAGTSFQDVKKEDWYYPAVASAQQVGIVNGASGTLFGAREPVSRQDMAVMLHRTLQALQVPLEDVRRAAPFQDGDLIRDYAKEAVASLRKAGIIEGMEDGFFDPEASTTRAQAAVLLYRLF